MEHEARRALVTGASSGIGGATAKRLAAEGFSVALLARNAGELERVRASLARPDEHFALVCDLRDPRQIDAAIARLRERWNSIDLLVHNAGHGYLAKIEESDPASLRSLFETNVVGVLDLSRAALPLLRASSRPVVVLVSSIVARRGIPGQIPYAASKAALNSIGEGLRIEWSPHRISVCILDVGLTRTPFFAHQPNPARLTGPNLSGAADPDSVALAILSLARRPRPELNLSSKWRLLAILSLLAPHLSDRLLVRRMGGGWRAPDW